MGRVGRQIDILEGVKVVLAVAAVVVELIEDAARVELLVPKCTRLTRQVLSRSARVCDNRGGCYIVYWSSFSGENINCHYCFCDPVCIILLVVLRDGDVEWA